MITREEIIKFAQQLPGAATDNPFDQDFDTTVLRHGNSGKWFGIILKAPCKKLGIDRDGETEILNLKCDPLMSFGLFQSCSAIIPAYHMNKYHWISIILEKEISKSLWEMLVRQSYSLTMKKPAKRKKADSSEVL